MVADSLSHIPGTELLTATELCSATCTLNVLHVPDLPPCMSSFDATANNIMFLNGIITVNERSYFRC